MGQNQVVGQHQATLKKFLLLERTKFLNPFRKQPPTNPLQSKSTRAISYAYGMIVKRNVFISSRLFFEVTSKFGPNPYRGFAVALQVVLITKQSREQTFRISGAKAGPMELSVHLRS